MIPRGPRTLGYYASSQWFQWAVLFLVLGSLATVLLSALDDIKERAEKQVVDLTLRNMRTGMRLAMGEALIQQREREIATWGGGNPVGWLGAPPVGYRGECSAGESRRLSGQEWCFERPSGELVYRPNSVDHLHDPVAEKDSPCVQLRWRVARLSESASSASFVGLWIESASTCQWVLD